MWIVDDGSWEIVKDLVFDVLFSRPTVMASRKLSQTSCIVAGSSPSISSTGKFGVSQPEIVTKLYSSKVIEGMMYYPVCYVVA